MADSCMIIQGGAGLEGKIRIQGAKNTALPVMAACLLNKGRTMLYHCPKISDVHMMATILEDIGCRIRWLGDHLMIDSSGEIKSEIPKGKAGCFRGSSLLLGALIARNGHVILEKPGGCQIGTRPLDYHMMGFQKMGVRVEVSEDSYICSCERLHGTVITLPYPSVGATENLMLAASGTEDLILIKGCACEPEIVDLAVYLSYMGVRIRGAGTPEISIRGSKYLRPVPYQIPYDRIVAATYLIGTMMTGGDITLELSENPWVRMGNLLPLLEQMGGEFCENQNSLHFGMKGRPEPIRIRTGPHPGVPTDIQPMILAATMIATGPSTIYEEVFDSRFQVVSEFRKMGGSICVKGNCAHVTPVDQLYGTQVRAMDLRGGAALILAGLAAEGETQVHSLYYVERGYENLEENLKQLGAKVQLSYN